MVSFLVRMLEYQGADLKIDRGFDVQLVKIVRGSGYRLTGDDSTS